MLIESTTHLGTRWVVLTDKPWWYVFGKRERCFWSRMPGVWYECAFGVDLRVGKRMSAELATLVDGLS